MSASSAEVFEGIGTAMQADSALAGKVNGTLLFVLTTKGADSCEWYIDCKEGIVRRGGGKAECTITMSDADFCALAAGKLNGMSAYMSGKMKIAGKTALAQKFATLTKAASKARAASVAGASKADTSAPAPATVPAATPADGAFKAAAVFAAIDANLKRDPAVAKKVNGVLLFNIKAGDSSASWTIDAKSESPGVLTGTGHAADCTISISDDDFAALAAGKLSGMAAYMAGKMKLAGNMGLAQKFSALVGGAKRSKL